MFNYLKISTLLLAIIGCKAIKSDKPEPTISIEGQYYITQIKAGDYLDSFDSKEYTCTFKDSSILAFIGCNRIGGSYKLKGSEIEIGPLFSTKMYCKEMATQEIKLISTLEKAEEFVEKDTMILIKGSKNHILTLKRIL